MDLLSLPSCGERTDALLNASPALVLSGKFPTNVDRTGGGSFAGTVTVTSTNTRVSGVTSAEADVFVARSGEVVCTPMPQDLIARPLDLTPGASQDLVARGAIVDCSAGRLLQAGEYELFVAVVVRLDDGSQVAGAGGPWPLQVT